MKIEIRPGTTIGTSVQADIDYVEENFREGDRAEHESMGGGRTDVRMFEDCWTIRHHGDIVGYCGIAVPANATPFSPARWLCFMSCENANKYKFEFVKCSRLILKLIAKDLPPCVELIMSLPAEVYTASLKWHERVLNMHRGGMIVHRNTKCVYYWIKREELET